ncbi:ABC transporter a family member 1 [Phtheirospermum japonicum]|uniref:ABC transporter a family member 1 n=1 Tax=Phtheirospermum japonicum TaxID=374723 RepID=A0A830CD74_9LAMI|nr:ABC transporter a family member 1 [Phtheirospermum japonicum]
MEKEKMKKMRSWRQLKAMLRKNWLLKIRHPFITLAEILLPTVVMLLLIAVRMSVDTRLHPPQAYIRKDMLVEVGKSDKSAPFNQILELLCAKSEYLAFAPDTSETRMMISVLSIKFPLLKLAAKVYRDEEELETYINSDLYGAYDKMKNCTNPKIKGAIVFHSQGPRLFDYSIRLNHTWAFAGFPDVKSIMDTNGPFLNDLELGVNIIPIMQYSFSGFLTLQQVMDSFIIFAAQQNMTNSDIEELMSSSLHTQLEKPWTHFNPSNIRLAPFPTREYTDDEFQSIVKRVMGVLYLLGFLYPISRLVSYSVLEKEQKIKEGLYMMGLKDNIFHLSWFLTYVLQFAVSSGIITLCTMGTLFKYSDKSLVFVYFFSFGLSSITLSFLISTFFTRAKTAVAVGTLAFLAAFFPYYSVDDETVSTLFKVMASFLSPTAFALGSINFADYERAHVGLRWSNIWRDSSGVCFLVCLLMMLLDTFLYGVIGLYFDKVFHKETGVRYTWISRLFSCFWKKNDTSEQISSSSLVKLIDSEFEENPRFSERGSYKPALEAISFEMKQQELDGRCIQIKNLHKVYTSKKARCCAVNSLQLTLYENQILALLGHNGAGKSTTMSMLVGLVRPTSGDALVFGKNILTDMDEIRQSLGVCPQYDILFPELTVKEHLEIFANIKGVNEGCLQNVVTEMAEEVGLADKLNTLVRALSGGMRRKLSLGIALIGNSKVIILDEPTSGMDPYSMRLTWQLIKRIKKGRIILLTTHSMDEADALGDRIAIMASGSLKCCGSSFFLKQQYGVGYTLTLVKTTPTASTAADIVYSHIPSATCVSEVGNEISFKLPLASSSSFESMFREIESCMQKSKPSFDSGIESYGISVTTLEEVFLRVAGGDFDETEAIVDESPQITPNLDVSNQPIHNNNASGSFFRSKVCKNYIEVIGFILNMMGKVSRLFLEATLRVVQFCSMQCCCSCIFSRSTFWKHSKALLIKRAVSARRDQKTIIFQLVIPAVFLLLGLLMIQLKPHPDQQSVTFTTAYFNPLLTGGGGGGPIPFDLSLPIANEVSEHVHGGWIQRFRQTTYEFPDSRRAMSDAVEAAGATLGPILLSMSEYLMSSYNESYQSRYGAVVMDKQSDDGSLSYTILHNSSCQHAAPTFINHINSAILRLATLNENMTIRTRNHPLPMTTSQLQQRHGTCLMVGQFDRSVPDLDAFKVAVVVTIAFSFIPASFAVAIVKEREVKAKHQQLISGAWINSSGVDSLFSTVLMFLGYGLSIASSTYCLTFFFSEHSMAQNVVLLVHFFTGLVLMVLSFIMGLLESTRHANSLLKNFFRLSPGFCFADGLASLALLRQGMKKGSGDSVFDWNVTGASICYLVAEGMVYFVLTLALEFVLPHKINLASNFLSWISKKNYAPSGSSSEPLLRTSSGDNGDLDEDVDVQAERGRVLSGGVGSAIVYLNNLRKVYPGGKQHGSKIAVHSLTFSVQQGECFGFLGTNGAGKTTTLSMLSGEEQPSDGTAYIFGKDIRSNPKAARQHIGYCPQFDALLEFLTVREHLQLYARIKGVQEYELEYVVMEKLLEFDLLKHADKPSYALSGGNKRKLSVAIAMIGDPPLVILDEPSTGMDPIAKRFMWEVISRLSTRRGKTAVILTTHSMDEAQALCTRIGIMVGGKLRCIGSPQHLKNRFGNHLELEVKPTEVSSFDLDAMCEAIQEKFFDIPSQPRGILNDLEVCIGGIGSTSAEKAAEINLSSEILVPIGRWLGNEERLENLISANSDTCGVFGEQLSEQLLRDGGIQLPVFAEWWLTKEKFAAIDSFFQSSFRGATYQGCDGLSVKYQLPYNEDLSLADVFGHMERNRNALGISEYSISQSTLETIFNHFATNT